LSQLFSVCYKGGVAFGQNRNKRIKQMVWSDYFMLPQTENTQMHDGQTQGQVLPLSGGRAGNRSPKTWLVLGLALLAVTALLVSGMLSRVRAGNKLRTETDQSALLAVSVVSPKQTAPADEIILPGNVQPFITSPIYSRTNGYLKKWYFDIGARVKQRQLLAVIETPEVDQQLQQARSNLLTAQANLELASITKARYQGLLKRNAVSQQDVDNAVGTYNANKAIVEADKATVKQYSALVSFEKIYAPFDGVITARNTDIGDLINSGSAGGVKTDLFHISQPGKLRVYVNVPEEYSQGTKVGMTADLSLAEFPGRKFQGKLVRTADDINVTTRTLLIEIDVDNPTGTLLTGSYAEVHLAVPTQASTFLVPVNTLLFRTEGLRVGIVEDGKVMLAAVTPGHDFGNQIEIVAGLKAADQVIVNPPDSLVSGQQVQIVQASLPGDIK
jgi:RND family efflux transporter MFP subunit